MAKHEKKKVHEYKRLFTFCLKYRSEFILHSFKRDLSKSPACWNAFLPSSEVFIALKSNAELLKSYCIWRRNAHSVCTVCLQLDVLAQLFSPLQSCHLADALTQSTEQSVQSIMVPAHWGRPSAFFRPTRRQHTNFSLELYGQSGKAEYGGYDPEGSKHATELFSKWKVFTSRACEWALGYETKRDEQKPQCFNSFYL